jgi:hypothetical protein
MFLRMNDDALLRMRCLEAAAAVHGGADADTIIRTAKHFLEWVTRGEITESAVADTSIQAEFVPAVPPTKPANMSIKDMVRTILRESGERELTALEILARIQDRWWPDLPRTSLSPQISRLARDGEISNRGGRYKIRR